MNNNDICLKCNRPRSEHIYESGKTMLCKSGLTRNELNEAAENIRKASSVLPTAEEAAKALRLLGSKGKKLRTKNERK
jgi:hypothetical protein